MEPTFKYSNSVVLYPLFAVVLLWFIFWADQNFYRELYTFGIYPQKLSGLKGVFLSPFIHGSGEHLLKNSIPLFVLLVALRYFYYDYFFKIIALGIFFSGLLTWIIGRENYHIGASGLIYVVASFIFFKGIQTQYYRLIALSLAVILVYGGMIWYVFPTADETISWEGHLAGFLTGIFLSKIFTVKDYTKPALYEWQKPDYKPEEDPFMQQFDKNGNFFEKPKEPEPENTNITDLVYEYKKSST